MTLALAAESWNALGQMLLALGAVTAGAWAAYTYRKTQRAEAARWMVSLFKDFYRDEDISRARELLEYDFFNEAGPILEMRVLDREVPLSDQEREQLRDLDLVLNYLEQLLFLESEGHIREGDRKVFFEYWFDQLSHPNNASLRRYLKNCGYERCSQLLNLPSAEFFAAYGSLMTGFGSDEEESARADLTSVGPCRIPGTLFSRGDYPALVRGESDVAGELFQVDDRAAFRLLDELEHFDPESRAKSMYRRRCIRLIEPPVDAWVYLWNEPTDSLDLLEHGSWAEASRA